MQSSNIPAKIPLPFAYAADPSFKNTIPTASQIGITNGKASLTDGFPPLTFGPLSAGGVPPFGADFNGILNEITAIQQWQNAGGFFVYDSAFSTAVGGYPKGAVLQAISYDGFWISTIENNTNNPDVSGMGWKPYAFVGLQAIAITSTSVALSNVQIAYPIIKFSGTLTGNTTVILPNNISTWVIGNYTTGAYTLTVKTSAGVGVQLTQSESTYIYGDGTNIYFADSAKVASFNGRVGTVSLNALDVTNALGYTPYNASNPSNYVTASQFPAGSSGTGSWYKVVNGLIVQGGQYNSPIGDGGTYTIAFPISFPNYCMAVGSSLLVPGPVVGSNTVSMHSWINGVGSANFYMSDAGASIGNAGFSWMAIGY